VAHEIPTQLLETVRAVSVLTPYRDMEFLEEPTMADEMREETERALASALEDKVSHVLIRIRQRAKEGLRETIWPDGGLHTQAVCEELAEILRDKGFSCAVRATVSRWFRGPDPLDYIWELKILW